MFDQNLINILLLTQTATSICQMTVNHDNIGKPKRDRTSGIYTQDMYYQIFSIQIFKARANPSEMHFQALQKMSSMWRGTYKWNDPLRSVRFPD